MALLEFILFRRLGNWFRRTGWFPLTRLVTLLVINLALTGASYLAALGLRFEFDFSVALARQWELPLLVLLTARVAAFAYWDLNQARWRYCSTSDLSSLLKAHFASSALFAAGVFLFRVPEFPRSVIFIEFGLSLLISGGLRLATRMSFERLLEFSRLPGGVASERQVLVLGAGDSGHLLIKTLLGHRRLRYKPIGVLDDSEWLRNYAVFGIPVLGPIGKLEEIIAGSPQLAAVIVAIPSYSAERLAEVTRICERHAIPFKRVQSFEDIACLDASEPRSSLTVEAVLDKEITVEHEDEVRAAIRGKRVLITGAGGSIGSELVRQVLQFGPKQVVLFDNGEYNLFRTAREFGSGPHSGICHYELGSICDEARLVSVFSKYKPQLVFHAAAYKHVPLLEENCYEAFTNNVLGTRNVLLAAKTFEAERFVLISTDKAVDPVSIMGVSKRIAELLTQAACRSQIPGERPFGAAAVRFGNVINSAGSVVPVFKEQIMSGGPITVTHPDMERYFMSIREAVRLVLTAGTLSDSGEVYVLDMGKPIKIVDLARKMLALYGRRDIPIVFTGIRPGEKLTECLSTTSEVRGPTRFSKVTRLVSTASNDVMVGAEIFARIDGIERRLMRLSDSDLIAELRAIVLDGEGSSPRSIAHQA